jgi:hypothetical protein
MTNGKGGGMEGKEEKDKEQKRGLVNTITFFCKSSGSFSFPPFYNFF